MTVADAAPGSTRDRDIEQDVRAELEMEEGAGLHHFVGVTADQGVVRLSGAAESYAQKLAIERAASRVVGVKDVRNHLEVRSFGDGTRGDREIEQAAMRALEWDARVPAGIRSEVTDGVLRLTGAVVRFSEREAAQEAVRNLIGVRDVVNEIKVAPVPLVRRPADLAQDVAEMIRRRFNGDAGYLSIAVTDGLVTLSGVVPTFTLIDEIERAVRAVAGVTRTDNRLLVAS